jgi:8-oxo-dGTP diphosphatase
VKITASLCYLKKNGKTLMMHRVKKADDIHHGKWNGLGGKMELGETPEECVVREVKEESGFRIKNPNLRGIMTFPKFDGKNDWIVFLFVAHQFKGKQVECNEGDLEWVPDNKLIKLPLWEGDKLFFKWLEQKNFFSAKFVYQKGKLRKHQVHFYPINR